MKKRIFALVSALVFAIVGIGTIATIAYTYHTTGIASAAISTSKTRLVQQRLKSWGY